MISVNKVKMKVRQQSYSRKKPKILTEETKRAVEEMDQYIEKTIGKLLRVGIRRRRGL